eukprot:SAG11_NODE_567_length_8488_cov_4.292764_6_plen_66_part_00
MQEDDGHAARMGLSPGYHGRLSLEQLLVRTGSSPTCRDNLELTVRDIRRQSGIYPTQTSIISSML